MDCEAPPTWTEGGSTKSLHPGQLEAWEAAERIVAVVAGSQGGKTVVGARLLLREVQRTARQDEPNDYLIVGPNVELLRKKAVPEFERECKGMVEYKTNGRYFLFTKEGSRRLLGFEAEAKVFLGYATEPDSLVSATYKGVWADECGQSDFTRDAWEEIYLRRTAVHSSRIFLTSTPYSVSGWFKDVYDGKYPSTRVVRFRSEDNPSFPKENVELARQTLPDWKFRQFHLGEFVRPAGSIYDCFERGVHVVEPFDVPQSWPRYVGIDFGQVNTFAVVLAEDPKSEGEKDLYAIGEYAGSGEAEAHVRGLLRLCPDPTYCVGGTWTGEDPEWRRDYIAAGLAVARPPLREVEPGIDRVYRQLKLGKLKFFSTCTRTVDDIEGYARELDEENRPTLAIADKHSHHPADALRYVVVGTRGPSNDRPEGFQRIHKAPTAQPRDDDRRRFDLNTKFMEEEEEVKASFKTRRLV